MLLRRQPSPVPGDQPLLARGGRAAGPLDHTADRGQLQGLKGQQDSGLPAGSGVRELLLPELELRGLPDLSTPWGQAESHCMATRKPAGMHEAANLRAWPQGEWKRAWGNAPCFPLRISFSLSSVTPIILETTTVPLSKPHLLQETPRALYPSGPSFLDWGGPALGQTLLGATRRGLEGSFWTSGGFIS